MAAEHLPYLSAEWFERVQALLGKARIAPKGAVAVGYDLPTSQRHQQVFVDDILWAWRLGISEADLVLTRSFEVDTGDLMGWMSPNDVAQATRVIGWRGAKMNVSILSLPFYSKIHFVPDISAHELEVRTALLLPNSPFGSLDAELTYRDDSLALRFAITNSSHLSIRAPYSEAQAWLAGEQIMGHMMYAGHAVRGDIFRMSALEAVVSQGNWFRHPAFSADLRRYGAARGSKETVNTLDEIESFTSPDLRT